MTVSSASDIVDDIAAKYPTCAQSCVKNALQQICQQNQTPECFCTTQPLQTAESVRECITQGITTSGMFCDVAFVIKTGYELCLGYGYDISGDNINPSTNTVLTVIVDSSPSPTVDGSTSESRSENGGGYGWRIGNGCGNGVTGRDSNQHTKDSGLSTGAIAGIIVGAAIAFAVVAGWIISIVKKQRSPVAPGRQLDPPPPSLSPLGDHPNESPFLPGPTAPPPPPPPPPPLSPPPPTRPEIPPEELDIELGLPGAERIKAD